MYVDLIIWDDENEPHITGPGEVTVDDVDEVIRAYPRGHDDPADFSDSSGFPLILGDTSTGKYLVVKFEDLSEDDLIIIRPKHAADRALLDREYREIGRIASIGDKVNCEDAAVFSKFIKVLPDEHLARRMSL